MGKTLQFNAFDNDKQVTCWEYWADKETSDIVYGGSKGSGKSYIGCSLIFSDAFTYPGTHYFIARKRLNDLRKYTIPSIYEVFEHWGIDERYYRFDGKDNFFELYNGSKVFLLDAKYQPQDPLYMRFGSMQMTRGWIEEAGEFEEAAKNNLFASLGRWKNEEYNLPLKLLQTCNPAKNYLYRDYYTPNKKGKLATWRKFIQALPQDNKRLPKGYLENLARVLTYSQKERLLRGNWEYDDDPNTLIPYANIMALFENDHVRPGNMYLTADVARFGADKAIILIWSGWMVIDYKVIPKSKITAIQNAINHYRIKYQIPKRHCIADDDGIGGGVVDNCGIIGFTNNARPRSEQMGEGDEAYMLRPEYKNLQTQCAYKLADKINKFELAIDCNMLEEHEKEIIEDLEQLKSDKIDDDRKLHIMSKKDVKDLIGRSPDWRDSLLMRSYFEFEPEQNQYYEFEEN